MMGPAAQVDMGLSCSVLLTYLLYRLPNNTVMTAGQ